MISLGPSSFESLQLYFSKFKALVLQLKQCGIEKKEEKLVLAIISKLGPDYSVFFRPSMPPSWQLKPERFLILQSSWNPSHRSKIIWWWWAPSNLLLSANCTLAIEIFRKLSPHLKKWERCDLGGKHRARYCHLLLSPPFRVTPNEAKGVVLTKEFLWLLSC